MNRLKFKVLAVNSNQLYFLAGNVFIHLSAFYEEKHVPNFFFCLYTINQGLNYLVLSDLT